MNRRAFNATAIQAILGSSILALAVESNALFKSNAKKNIQRWLKSLSHLSQNLNDELISAEKWQSRVQSLFAELNFELLLKEIDFSKIVKKLDQRKGRLPKCRVELESYFSGVEIKQRIYKFSKGVSIPPHAHNGMVSAHLVLNGSFRAQSFDRLFSEDDDASYMNLKNQTEKVLKKSDFVTMSDEKQNIHSLSALEDDSYVYYIAIKNVKSKQTYIHQADRAGMIYLDIENTEANGTRVDKIRARKIGRPEALAKYGQADIVSST